MRDIGCRLWRSGRAHRDDDAHDDAYDDARKCGAADDHGEQLGAGHHLPGRDNHRRRRLHTYNGAADDHHASCTDDDDIANYDIAHDDLDNSGVGSDQHAGATGVTDEPKSLTQSAERWLSLAALVVAPTSLITGLCYYFGLIVIRNRLKHFGVDPSSLGYTSADYAVTVIAVFFFAALRVLVVLALLVVLAVAVRHWAGTGRRITLLRGIAWLSAVLGAAGLTVAVVWLTSERSLINWIVKGASPMYMAGLMVTGIALLAAGYWMLALTGGIGGWGRLPMMAERALLALAAVGLVVTLFWVTGIFAESQGKLKGSETAGKLWAADGDYPAVQLDTTETLDLPDNMVKMTVLASQGPPGPPVYRYQCLRVLEAHAGRYVLVPARWSRDQGVAITVTPDATHRITTVVDSTPVAAGPNIDPYWQCPELVRTYQKSDLDHILIGAEGAEALVGTGRLSVTGPDTNSDAAPALSNSVPSKACAAEGVPSPILGILPAYPDTVVATRERRMAGESDRTWIRQRAMIFPNPGKVEDYLASVWNHWEDCEGQTVAVDRPGKTESRILGARARQAGILSVLDSVSADRTADCSLALAAKSNIVVAVDLCGTAEPARAVAVAYAIRGRIPTDY